MWQLETGACMVLLGARFFLDGWRKLFGFGLFNPSEEGGFELFLLFFFNRSLSLYTGLPGYGRRVKRHKAILVPIVWHPMNDVLPANPRRQPFARFLSA